MARRLCRLSRLFPLVSSASATTTAAAAARPRHLPFAVNPNPAPLVPCFPSPSPHPFPAPHRLFSSASDSNSSMVVVGSADSFNSILSKVQDEKLQAVFYYTAVWCGPCRAIAPFMSKLSSQYPKIPIYKVDIDLEGLDTKLRGLNICSVPTFHFYHQGQKIDEIVGADGKKLQAAMESLHKQQ